MSFVLRVVLPDRPGTLGAVATALGEVGADILAMDVVERSPDLAVDDIVVALPSGRQPDSLITAAEGVEGVHVESVRPDPGIAARHKEWELVEAIAADPKQAVQTLARMLPLVWLNKKAINKHTVDVTKCILCQTCAKKCPVDAIHPEKQTVNRDKCLACFGCLNNCPAGAVVMEYRGKPLYGFPEYLRRRKINILEPPEIQNCRMG